MTDERAAQLLGTLRDGWHGLAGGDARSCPGCPVCALTEQAGRLDPTTAAHLQAAAGHLVAAGREMLAVLGARAEAGTPPPGDAPAGQPADPPPVGPVVAGWTKIPVSTPETDEEHP